MDWATLHLLAWQPSNTMEISFSVGALGVALDRGTPEILNTDSGPSVFPTPSPAGAERPA